MSTRRALGWLGFLVFDLWLLLAEGSDVHHIGATGPVVGSLILPAVGYFVDVLWCELVQQGRRKRFSPWPLSRSDTSER